jgi:hypothetical protein
MIGHDLHMIEFTVVAHEFAHLIEETRTNRRSLGDTVFVSFTEIECTTLPVAIAQSVQDCE